METFGHFCQVNSINENGPGGQAGIKYGDFLMTYDGKTVESPEGFRQLMEESEGKDGLKLVLIRAGIVYSTTCTGGWLDFSIGNPKPVKYLNPTNLTTSEENLQKGLERTPEEVEQYLLDAKAKYLQDQKDLFSSIQMATLPAIDGYRVSKNVGVIGAECVYGMNFIKDIFSSVRDFVGGNNAASQKAFRDGRLYALQSLKEQAFELKCNAVIGIQFSFGDVSSGVQNGQMLMICATGTAVILEKTEV